MLLSNSIFMQKRILRLKSHFFNNYIVNTNDPNFIVYCTICGKSERKWSSLMKHLQRHHKDVDTQSHSTLEDIVIDDGDSDIQLTDTAGDSIHFQKSESALFLLRATKELSLTHSAVDHLCEFSQSFC